MGDTKMINEINIIWEKEKPSIEEIEKLAHDNDVHIYGAPLEVAEELMKKLNEYVWEIREDIGAETCFDVPGYWRYKEILTKGISTVHEIYVSKLHTGCNYCTPAFMYIIGWD